jgi:PAS domain S-box-containing protein
VAHLPLAAYMCDNQGLISYCNSYAAEFWGREPEPRETLEDYCDSLQLFDDNGTRIRHSQCWIVQVLRTRRAQLGKEITAERPDGTRRTGIVNAQPIFGENGELLGALDVVIDITDRKHAEEQFRVAVEASPSALIVAAPDGRIALVNSQTEALFGYDREELLGQPVEVLVPPPVTGRAPRTGTSFGKPSFLRRTWCCLCSSRKASRK